MGGWYWKMGCMLIGFIFLGGGILDTLLYASGRNTISDFLRHNPSWYWYPAGLIIMFLVLLAIHLWIRP